MRLTTDQKIGLAGLIVCIFACIGTYLTIPEVREAIAKLTNSQKTAQANPTNTLPLPTVERYTSTQVIQKENADRVQALRVLQSQDWVEDVAFSPDGTVLAWAGNAGIWLYDLQQSLLLNHLTGHTGQVHGVVFSPDGERLYSGGVDAGGGRVREWDWRKGTEVQSVIAASEGWGVQVGISYDGKWLVTSGGGRCILWRVQGDGLQQYKSLNFSFCRIPIISPDRKWVAAAEENGVRLVSFENDESRFLSTPDSPGLRIGFSPDARIIASGVKDSTVRLWLVNDGTLLRTLNGRTGPVEAVTFSPDGQVLAAGMSDGKVLLWQVSDGTLLHTLVGHTGGVTSVAFSSDGHLLASGSNDATVRLWGVKP